MAGWTVFRIRPKLKPHQLTAGFPDFLTARHAAVEFVEESIGQCLHDSYHALLVVFLRLLFFLELLRIAHQSRQTSLFGLALLRRQRFTVLGDQHSRHTFAGLDDQLGLRTMRGLLAEGEHYFRAAIA